MRETLWWWSVLLPGEPVYRVVRRGGFYMSLVVLGVLTIVMGWPRSAIAAGGSTITMAQSGVTISVAEPWSIGPVSDPLEGAEFVMLTGTNDTLVIGYLPAGPDSDAPVAAALSAVDLALPRLHDLQVNDQWVFQFTTVEGVPYGLFGLIRHEVPERSIQVQIYISPVSTFGTGIEALRGAAKIDGNPVFVGVNGGALQATLESKVGNGDALADAERAPLTTTTIKKTAVYVEGNREASSDEHEAEWTGRWTSPRYGMDIRWTDEWQLGEPPLGFVAARPLDISSAGTPDRLVLERVDGSGTTLVVHAWPSNGALPEQWFTSWSIQNATYGWTVSRLDGDSPAPRVVGTVVRYIDGSRVGEVDVREARLAYGELAHLVLDLTLPSGSTGDDFQAAASGVTINGESPFLLVRPYNVDASIPGSSPTKDANNTVNGG